VIDIAINVKPIVKSPISYKKERRSHYNTDEGS